MKFTLTSNDKLKFKIVLYSYSFFDTTLIKNFRFCRAFYHWLQEKKEIDRNNCKHDNIWLDIHKGTEEITYKLEDIQLICLGEGNKSKIHKIEINVKENAPKARIKIFVDKSYSFNEKIKQVIASIFRSSIKKKD